MNEIKLKFSTHAVFDFNGRQIEVWPGTVVTFHVISYCLTIDNSFKS